MHFHRVNDRFRRLSFIQAVLICWLNIPAAAQETNATSDRQAAKSKIQSLYDAAPDDGIIDSGGDTWPSAGYYGLFSPAKLKANKSVLWNFTAPLNGAGEPAFLGGNPPRAAIGDNDITESFWGGHLNLMRSILTGDPGSANLFISLDDFSKQYKQIHYDSNVIGEFPNVPALQVNASTHRQSSGQVNGINVSIDSEGNNPFSSEDQGLSIGITKGGQNSTWAISTQTNDTTGLPPEALASVAAEYDILANGPDDPASLYNPVKGNRIFMWLAAKHSPIKPWIAEKHYVAGDREVSKSPSGAMAVYVASGAGTSGTVPPIWPATGAVADGTVTWIYGEPYNVTFGRGIALDGQPGTSFSTGISGNARFGNAVIDLSTASMLYPYSAGIRLAANMRLDFSANATAAGQNRHTLAYSSAVGGLTYAIDNVPALTIKNNQLVTISGHIANTGGSPKLSACGAGSTLSSSASDRHGTVTSGAQISSCTVVFNTPYDSAPDCLLTGWQPKPPYIVNISKSSLVVGNPEKFSYLCEQ